MAAIKLDTVTGREALAARHAPYWLKVRAESHLGFRKTTATSMGAWIARYRDEGTGKYQLHSLGSLDKITGARRYDEAVKLAIQWFDHRSSGGTSTSINVTEAWDRYIARLTSEGKTDAVKDAKARFRRWIEPDAKLSKTPILKLTAGQINDWRVKLASTPAIPQDKSKPSTKPRSASTLNRDMAVFKAVLNLALEDGHATTDAAWRTKLKPVKNATRRRDCYLDIDQRRALIAHAPPDLAAFIRGMALLPFRPGAVAALKVGDFDKRLGVLTVGKDKAGQDRKITLPPSTAAFFTEQSKGKLPGAALCARENGAAWDKDSWKGPIKDAVIAAGLPAKATAYALRHSTITDLIGIHRLDTMTVAILSGTSIAMIEKHYGHLLHDRAATGLAALAL